jgi:hypothetical protein
MISLRVPVTPANRSYLRELRHAEMRAWQNPSATARRSATREVVPNAQNQQADFYSFSLIVVLTLALSAIVIAQSPGTSQRVAHWVSIVRNVLG